nr:Crp/Fnr family transcriptional regulator [Bacteroidota bacterium]
MTDKLLSSCHNCSMKSSMFKFLTSEELDLVSRTKKRVLFKSGEIIVKQGAPLSHVISFTSGLAKVYIEGTGNRNLLLHFVKPTQFLGSPGIYTDSTHYFSVAAIENASVCFIDIHVFKKIIRENCDFANAFMKDVSQKGIFNYQRFISLTHKNMPGRVADGLIYMYTEIFNNPTIKISRQDLADFTGMSKDSVVRTLKELAGDDIIEINDEGIKILNLEKLHRIGELG